MLTMTYRAVFFFVLGVQVTLISASVVNTTSNSSDYEDHTPSFFISNTSSTHSTMSTMINTTELENATDVSYTDITTSEGDNSTSHEFSDVTPSSPSFHSSPVPTKTTTKSRRLDLTTTPLPESDGSDSVGIIILIVIIVSALLAALICYIARNKGRRFSVELTSRPDEVQIPLSYVEPEAVETITPNGLEFEGTEEPQEAQAKLDDQVEQKETERVTTDANANSAAQPADISEDQSKQDVPEQSSGAPAGPSEGEKTDDEEALSNKSSEKSQECNEANENNCNNTVLPQREGEAFWNMPLDSMV